MKRCVLGVLMLAMALGLAGEVTAQSVGGAACLQITPGARADGMGRAFVALPTDATANWWNPAALALQKGQVISLMHAKLVPGLADDVYYEHLGYSMYIPGWGGVGASLIYLTYGKSPYIDLNGDYKGDFTSNEWSPQISIGTEVVDGFAAGATLKYVRINLAPDWVLPNEAPGSGNGDSYGVDLAVLLRSKPFLPNFPSSSFPIGVNIGVNVQNIGPKVVFISADNGDPLPRLLKAGIGIQWFDKNDLRILTCYDFNQSLIYTDEIPINNFGAEVAYRDFVFARAGYISDMAGDIRAMTYGMGFVLNLQSLGASGALVVDYASVPQARDLPERVNKFSLSFRF